jgi:hypothetical protein
MQMTNDQKDAMIEEILNGVYQQMQKLAEEGRIDDCYALCMEWEEHFNPNVTDVHIITINSINFI